ncbi:MAG: lysophospholipase [Oscillatoriaceae bacterium SKW80]|nr:lysophospholipase [Oscillatoriaceae bacterium SKYG93]MCX8119856.1 lysophospholipase [Oscillatoriaceae bacterium SKW80]MDW8452038.1 alpha/beta hydrolase [Oscillatoriaceae cyanobacterium SKYGB_i_bin93]HIK27521.1 alpha/beta hydrolase [Oscillatoriaceae cyanobacterium M7585_C2015_266]
MTHTLLQNPEILKKLFHPKGWDKFEPLDPNTRNIAVEVDPNIFIRGLLYPAAAHSPAILFFHSNNETVADLDAFADFFIQMGITLLLIDYRGYGISDGIPTAINLLSDALKVFLATEHIFKSNNLNPERLYVLGRCLGAAAALEVAFHAKDKIAGVILESGFAETLPLLERLGIDISQLDEERDGFGNALKISRITVPTLIVHGKEDFLISPEQAEKLYRNSGALEKQIVLIPKVSHNNLMIVGVSQGKSPYFEAIRKFIFNK